MSGWLIAGGAVAYMAAGWWLYVPGAVARSVERQTAKWDADAARQVMEQRDELRLKYGRLRNEAVDSEMGDAMTRRLELIAQQETDHLERVQALPAPVEEIRRWAAIRWPWHCLVWLPVLVFKVLAVAWMASIRHTARRSVPIAGTAADAVAARRAEIAANEARLERELTEEFGITFGSEVEK